MPLSVVVAGVLTASVGVVQRGCLPPRERHVERGEDPLPVDGFAHAPAHDAATEEVDHNRQVEPALGIPDVGDVACPGAVGRGREEVTSHDVGSDRVRMLAVGGSHETASLAGLRLSAYQGPSPTWRSFLRLHLAESAGMDFFVIPTATFGVLLGFVVVSHRDRRVLHLNVTAHPTEEWTNQQLREAFPWVSAPRYLHRDRDKLYSEDVRTTLTHLGIREVPSAARSSWQNPYAERVVDSIRRELLDPVVVLNEAQLGACCASASATTMRAGRTCRSGKMRPRRVRCRAQSMAPK